MVTDPEFLASDELFSADVLIQHYVNWQRPGLSEKAKANLLRFVAEGRGLTIVHFANGAFMDTLPGAKGSDWPDYRNLLLRRWWDFAKGSTQTMTTRLSASCRPRSRIRSRLDSIRSTRPMSCMANRSAKCRSNHW